MPLLVNGTAPAANSKAYTSEVNTANEWTSVDFTGSGWANSDRARIARIDLRLVGAEEGDLLSLSRIDIADPGTDHIVADHQAGLSLSFTDLPKATSWRWRTSGSVTVSMIVWYNILPEGYV
jgi:hypothetical protein